MARLVKIFTFFFFAWIITAVAPHPTWAACSTTVPTPQGDVEVVPIGCLEDYVRNAIAIVLPLAGAVALLFLILGGIKFILSSGDPKAAQGAKSTMTYAVLGLVVILLIYFIFEIIKIATGVDLINSFKVVYP